MNISASSLRRDWEKWYWNTGFWKDLFSNFYYITFITWNRIQNPQNYCITITTYNYIITLLRVCRKLFCSNKLHKDLFWNMNSKWYISIYIFFLNRCVIKRFYVQFNTYLYCIWYWAKWKLVIYGMWKKLKKNLGINLFK